MTLGAVIDRAVRSRGAWALVVSLCSSGSGLLIAVAVARGSTVDEMGEYGVGAAALVLLTALARSAVTDPLVAMTSTPESRRRLGRASAIGAVGAVVLGAAAFLLGSGYLLVGALAVHGLTMRECTRAVLVARGAITVAVVTEATWLMVTVGAFCGTASGVWDSISAFAIWAGAGAVLGYGAAWRTGSDVRPSWAATPVPTARSLAFGGDTMIGSGVVQLVTWVATAIGGLPVAAALRGAGTLAGPVTVGLTAARSVLIPRAVDRLDGDRGLRGLARDAALLCGLATPFLVLLAVVPDPIGAGLLGATWPTVRPILVVTAIELFFQLVAAVPETAHRALGAGQRILVLRCTTAGARIPLVVLAAPSGVGAVVSCAAAVTAASSMIWWISLVTLAHPRSPSSPRPTTPIGSPS
jgi:hypothetical protein